jgi:hypothetical protein
LQLDEEFSERKFRERSAEGRERMRGSSMVKPLQVGEQAKLEYIDFYKNINRIKNRNSFMKAENTPITAYLAKVDSSYLRPKPYGIVRRKGLESEINIRSYGMGDSYAAAFSDSLALNDDIERIDLAGNRLTDRGGIEILRNLKPVNIIELELSENTIGNK